ncbi:hypothetical protein ACFOZ0_25215 [Streptomyces yaanensis]|uniref:Uncharacterized protein n=1 Tax=Streptomyces yaanensis TaxID=1142239 RepID=A0ABV7SJ44_9ACTN|nr:hypothetical protein [Streptomyces sp. CGMCC 4.7035]WNC01491.1 hypothetical protein Q2K21_27420 [Streptomyces sp. CGMCC 4.7035]
MLRLVGRRQVLGQHQAVDAQAVVHTLSIGDCVAGFRRVRVRRRQVEVQHHAALRERHQMRSLLGGVPGPTDDRLGVSGEITDGRVDLIQGEA